MPWRALGTQCIWYIAQEKSNMQYLSCDIMEYAEVAYVAKLL